MNREKLKNDFLSKVKNVHKSKYDYSLIEYVNSKTKIIIICPIHEKFTQTPEVHLTGSGCPKCSRAKAEETKLKNLLIVKNSNDKNKILLNSTIYCLIDEEDFEKLSKIIWYSSGKYAESKYGLMHRFLLNVHEKHVIVDHINGDPLDNRKSNLRLCTHQENGFNQKVQKRLKTSKFKGVFWDKNRNKWGSAVKLNGKRFFLGRFSTEIEAAEAYDEKARELFGEFAYLNFG